MEKASRILILIRHAERDTRLRELDNGLNKKGKKTAEKLVKNLLDSLPKDLDTDITEQIQILSSPKLRCIETLKPLSQHLHIKFQTSLLLDERQPQETDNQFKKRIQDFFSHWKKGFTSITFLCSHGDWLPIAMENLISTPAEFKKGSWAALKWSEGKFVLIF